MSGSGLSGRRVLIAEDESRVAMLMRDTLEGIGCEIVAVASRLHEARENIATLQFDVAILDVNLNGEPSFPLANELAERGLPFIFAAGYGESKIPPELKHAPVLQKPFLRAELERALLAALATRE